MALTKPRLEEMAAKAKAALDHCVKTLETRGVKGKKALRLNPGYRAAEATVRQIASRLRAVQATEELNVATAQRTTEKAAAPKVKKEKKKVEAAPAKAKKAKG